MVHEDLMLKIYSIPIVQIPALPDASTPGPGPIILPEFKEIETHNLNHVPEQAMYANTNTHLSKGQQDSPDSGHKEMSSDSLSYNLSGSDNNGNGHSGNSGSWYPLTASQGAYNINGPHHMKPLHNSGINVHGQEFNLQMRNPQNVNSKVSLNNNSFNANPFSPKKEMKSPKSDSKQDTQIITPLPSQDASGNKLELNVAPKIEPPPKVKRTSSRTSQGGQADLLVSPDSCQTISSRSSTTSDTSFSDKRNSRDSSKIGDDLNANLTSLMSPLSKSNNSSTATSPNHNTGAQHDVTVNFSKGSQKFHAVAKQQNQLTANEKECNMNNLSHSPSSRQSQNSNNTGTFISPADSTTKLRLSFSDEENTENSEDSGVPQQANNGLDSMTFEEFDALGS